jgi:serine/threonine protein kinase
MVDMNSKTQEKEIRMETDHDLTGNGFKVPETKPKVRKSIQNGNAGNPFSPQRESIISSNGPRSLENSNSKQELNEFIFERKYHSAQNSMIVTPNNFEEKVLNSITKLYTGKKLSKKHENDFQIILELTEKFKKFGAKFIDYNDIMFDNLIGNGGHSKVFSGWIDKQCYAIKEFLNVNETNLRKIFEEINIQISFQHENINKAKYIAFDLNPFKIASVSKLMLYNLRYVINSLRPKIKLKTKIIQQIFTSLEFLHSQCPPVVHRDLKPENILLDENFHVELCDFGIFKVLESNKTCCETLNQFYTIRYSPPEVIKNCNFICKASDIWSVGMLIYDIFYEEQPWTGLTNEEIIDSIKKERPFTVKNNDRIPEYITAMIKRCTNYDYSMRPKVSDLLVEVNNFIKETEGLCF